METTVDFIRNFDSYSSFSGIGAIIRIPNAERDKAISSSKFLILKYEFLQGLFHIR
jgi:hypothetical protein